MPAKFCWALLVIGCLGVSAASGQPREITVPYEQFTLPNGLNVIVHRDTTTPSISVNVWYHVGSAQERPDRTGFAHLFEHLMFEGSKHVPEGKIDEWLEAVGGAPNGSTSTDRTNYMETIASNALDLALFIESDRMGALLEAMTPERVSGQREVVKNERRENYENRPYGLAWQAVLENLFPAGYPYRWPVIGYMEHLDAAGYEDVAAFFRQYYTPRNASLVLAGDLDVAAARAAVEKWFGDLPAGPPVPALAVAQPVLEAEKRRVLYDRVQLPRLYMAWITPSAYAPGDAEMTAVAELLAGGKNSRLYRRLVYDLQIADDVTAVQGSSKLCSIFTVTATARSGHSLAELEAAVEAEIERLKREPPSHQELERIVNQHEARFLEGLEPINRKADQLNAYFFYTGNPDYFNEDLARFYALRPEDLSAMAARHLSRTARVVISVVPVGQGGLAAPERRADDRATP